MQGVSVELGLKADVLAALRVVCSQGIQGNPGQRLRADAGADSDDSDDAGAQLKEGKAAGAKAAGGAACSSQALLQKVSTMLDALDTHSKQVRVVPRLQVEWLITSRATYI